MYSRCVAIHGEENETVSRRRDDPCMGRLRSKDLRLNSTFTDIKTTKKSPHFRKKYKVGRVYIPSSRGLWNPEGT